MSKKRRGQKLANLLDSDLPTPDKVNAMFNSVDQEEFEISKKNRKEEIWNTIASRID